jgi:transposase-like protein
MNFKSLPQLLDHFKDEETCIKFAEQMIWKGNPICPHCKTLNPYKTTRGYKCSNSECYKKFTVKIGTIFEHSPIKWRTWIAAMYLCIVHKRGISSVQLATDLGVTQSTAWYMLHRIREMMKNQDPEMVGQLNAVEVDESHIGGIEGNRHKGKRRSKDNPELANDGTRYNKKKTVVGVIERGGKVVLKHIDSPSSENIFPVIDKYVEKGNRVMTDESTVYFGLGSKYNHSTVTHTMEVWVNKDAHTNTIENFFSVLKRTIGGTYYQISEKHTQKYLNECQARFNSRDVTPFDRICLFLSNCKGNIMYKTLIANDNGKDS